MTQPASSVTSYQKAFALISRANPPSVKRACVYLATVYSDYMETEEVIDKLTTAFPIATRAKLRNHDAPSAWSRWFVLPVPGYIEASSYGPVPKREIDWIELDPVEIGHIGRLVPPKQTDRSSAIQQQLQSEGVAMQMVGRLIRIAL